MKTQLYKIYEIQQKQFLEVHSNTRPSSKHKKIIANKLTHNLKELEKEQIKAMEQKEGKFRGWSAEGRKVEVRKEIK